MNKIEDRKDYRAVWISNFGHPPKGFQIHHIIPRGIADEYMEENPDSKIARYGVNWIGNLIALHPRDHHTIHVMRGDKWSEPSLMWFLKGRVYSEEEKIKARERADGDNNPSAKHKVAWMNLKDREVLIASSAAMSANRRKELGEDLIERSDRPGKMRTQYYPCFRHVLNKKSRQEIAYKEWTTLRHWASNIAPTAREYIREVKDDIRTGR